MPLDLALLAATIVSKFLIPYAQKGAEKLAETLTDTVGEGAGQALAGLAGKVWGRVSSAFHSDAEKSALENLREFPNESAPLLEAMLKRKMIQEPELAESLDRLISAPVEGGQSGAVLMGEIVGQVDLRGATVSGSHNQFTGVNLGKQAIGIPSPGPVTPHPTRPDKEEQDN